MKTSSEIYSWILTSVDFKPSNFTIGYLDAIKKKYIDVPLLKWKPIDRAVDPGDIPWTRVYFIKWKGLIVWDREKRICDLSHAVEIDQCLQSTFKVMSFNILSDVYEKSITDITINKRIDQIIEFIEQSDADIICLQEITESNLAFLRKTQYLIHLTDAKTNNIAILSKIPPSTFMTFGLGNIEKQAIMCIYNLENGSKLNVVGIHLTSNTNRNARSTRTQQVNRIEQFLSINGEPLSPTIILGDTNEPDRIEQFYRYIDSNGSIEPTYNPQKNTLARKLSDTKNVCRYDRIYSSMLKCNNFSVIENNVMSDHYPIIGEYEWIEHMGSTINVQTNRTALSIIPPAHLNLPTYNEKWMPHINVFWPFLPEQFFEKYHDLIQIELEKINFESFEIDLNIIGSFDHEKKSTIFYDFNEETIKRIKQIRKLVSKIIGFQNEDKPIHLSLELCPNDINIKRKIISRYNQLSSQHFNVDAIYMISCENSDQMLIRNMITLKKITRNEFILRIELFLAKFNVKIVKCGSDAFELESEDSDVDILCEGTIDRNIFFDLIYVPSLQCGLFYKSIDVKNDHTYVIKLYSDVTTVDIHYINTLDRAEKYYLQSVSMRDDPLIIKSFIEDYELFKSSLKYLRNLLKSNKIYGQNFCYLSGISIAIIVAYIINHFGIKTLDEFIASLQEFDATQIISLEKRLYTKKTKSDQFFVILQPSPPFSNTVRNIIRSTHMLTIDCIRNQRITFNLPNLIIFKVENLCETEISSNQNLKDLTDFTQHIIMRFLLQVEKLNDSYILKPSDQWKCKRNFSEFFIEHNCDQGEILFYLERTEKNLRELFRGYQLTITQYIK